MTKTEIFDKYAIEQGYDSWRDLTMEYGLNGQVTTFEYLEDQNNVTDLIQEELKKKISVIAVNKFLERHINWGELENSILNTEIL